MDLYYRVGQIITLGDKGFYTIRTIIGRGSSSVVYLTDYADESGNVTEHILKEYNPKQHNLRRDETGFLSAVNETDSALFTEGQLRFESGMKKQLELRRCDELKNYTSNIQKSIHANGTIYIDMTVTSGTAYQNVQEKSLYDLMRRMKVLTHVIGIYHKKGYLHLDIKPENIYVRPENETCEDVLLFDFDSVTAKNDITNNALLSYTQQWAAMEQILPNRRSRICEATDLFAIGEIIFFKLTGRHSENTERSALTEFGFDYSSRIFENVNPKVMPLLTELFGKTLCNSVNRRYQKADELEEQLDRIISLCDPQKPYLKSTLPSRPSFFVGREKEVEEIHNKLAENDIVFLSGVGGIGKSELAKYYAHEYKDCYDTIVFAPYVSNMLSMITNDDVLPIYNFFCYPEEKPDEYYKRKMKKLRELCDKNTLLIVDNLDTEDSEIDALTDLGCKLLVTTRLDFSDVFPCSQINIGMLRDPFEVFNEYYKKTLSDEERREVNEIIDIICGHTMTVELLAKQMMAGRVKPQKMLEKLKEGGISQSGREKVRTFKDGKLSVQNTYEHIKALFDLSELDSDEIYILVNLALIPYTGIYAEQFCKLCMLDSFDSINELKCQGWIMHDTERDIIYVHNVPGEILLNRTVLCDENISFLNRVCEYTKQVYDNLLYDEYIDEHGEFVIQRDDSELINILIIITGISCNFGKLKGNEHEKVDFWMEFASLLETEHWSIDHAIRNYLEAINLIRKIDSDNIYELGNLYWRVSADYDMVGNVSKAEEYLLKLLELAHKYWPNEKKQISEIYTALGALVCDRSEEYYLKALEYAKLCCPADKMLLSKIYRLFGDLMMMQGDSKAEEYYKLALENVIEDTPESRIDVISICMSLEQRLRGEGRNDEANKYAYMVNDFYKKMKQ